MHEARAGLTNAQALLQRWVGEAAAQSLGSPPDFHRTRLSGHQLGNQVDHYPDVMALEARERVALAQADVARQEKTADWSWSLMYSQRGSQFGDMVSFGVSVPLLWDQANKQDRELAARLHELEQVRLEREELRRERLFEVQRLIANWQSRLTAWRITTKPCCACPPSALPRRKPPFGAGRRLWQRFSKHTSW